MAELIILPNLRDGYVNLVQSVMWSGRRASPRGEATRELEDVTFVVRDPSDVLPVGVGRGLNLDIGVMEALQLVAGRSEPELLAAAAPQYTRFAEWDGHYHGAYGKRITDQVAQVIGKLKRDPDTRQAVITLWDPLLDNQRGMKDYPCTIALGFRIRDGHLNLSVTMRSNDVWLGTAYDVFQFTQLQHTVANSLKDVVVGTYTHTAWSLHLYERDVEAAERLTVTDTVRPAWHPLGFTSTTDARRVLHGSARPSTRREWTPGERWYIDRLMNIRKRLTDESSKLG